MRLFNAPAMPGSSNRVTVHRMLTMAVADPRHTNGLKRWRRVRARSRRRWWQAEVKAGPGIGTAVGPDPAAVTRNDPLHDGKPDAAARVLIRRVHALKHAEQLVRV